MVGCQSSAAAFLNSSAAVHICAANARFWPIAVFVNIVVDRARRRVVSENKFVRFYMSRQLFKLTCAPDLVDTPVPELHRLLA
jgi:hypothetical protein